MRLVLPRRKQLPGTLSSKSEGSKTEHVELSSQTEANFDDSGGNKKTLNASNFPSIRTTSVVTNTTNIIVASTTLA